MNAKEFQQRYGSPILVAEKAREAKAQIRIPKSRIPNKTEANWMEQCLRRHIGEEIRYEPFSLNLPSGTRYTPDVVVFSKVGGHILAVYEVKGPHIHNQRSIHAFKEARSAFPWWPFIFAQLTKQGWATA